MRLVLIAILLFMTANPALAQGGFGGHGYGWATNRSGGGGGGLTSPVGISDGGTGQTSKAAAFNALSPLTTLGDLLYGGASGAGTRLAGNTSTTRKYLGQTGTGSASQAPTFTQPNFNELLGNITFAQFPTLSSGNVIVGDGSNVAASVAMSGDATISNGGAVTIANNAVTNAKAAQMAAHTYKGNNTGSTANAADITNTQLTADLNLFSSSLKGLTPASGGGTTNFLRADGTWAAPAGGGGMTNPMTTTGDTIYSSDGSGTPARLGIGKYDQQYSPNASGVPAWSDRPVAPSVTSSILRTPWFQRPSGSTSTSFTASGTGATTNSGTVTSGTGTDGTWLQFVSTATTNNDAGTQLSSGSSTPRYDGLPRFWTRFKVVDTTVLRFFCGFSGGAGAWTTDTATQTAGFRYNPATDVNGNIRFYTMDGSTANVIDTGIPFAAGIYVMCVDCSDPASYKGYINGSLVATSSTNLPGSTQTAITSIKIRTLENVAKTININSLYGDNI